MGKAKDNYRTYAHRRFKGELTHLSRLHWAFRFSAEFTLEAVISHGDNDRLMTALPVKGFESQRLNISVGTFRSHIDEYIDHLRVLLLVKACANMEDYLHRMAQIWAVANGYFDAKGKLFLDRRGKALVEPALVSNLESCLSYLGILLETDLGSKSGICGKAYKMRCIAAHNGGIVDHEAIRVFSEMESAIGKPIRLQWERLLQYLEAISETCSMIELAIPGDKRLKSEVTVIVGELIKAKECGTNDEPALRKLLRDRYKFNHLPGRKSLAALLRLFA